MAIRLAGELFLDSTPGESELKLSDLQDVTVNGPLLGEFLAWNGATQGWENRAITVDDLATSGVTAGTYNNVTVNDRGIVTAATTVPYLTGNQNISISGDAIGNGTTSIALVLANTGVSSGTYGSATQIPVFQVDTKGRITSVTTTNIPVANTSSSGLLSSVDKQKLDSISVSADPNQTINAGDGLAGGGNGSTIELSINAGDGIQLVGDAVALDTTVIRTSGGQTISGNLDISGDLTVGGSTFEPGNVSLASPFANLNFDDSGPNLPDAANSGIIVHRGGAVGSPNPTVGFQWNESTSQWEVQSTPGGTFQKLWHNGNMGSGTGLDADLLDGEDGAFYQDASNLASGTMSVGRLPAFVGGDATSPEGSSLLTLANTGVTAGNYGTGILVPTLTIDSKGRIITANVATIPTATTSQTGLMTPTDKSKLDGIVSGAKGNQTIIAGDGLAGGGNTDSVTLNVDSTVVRVNDGGLQSIAGDITIQGNLTVSGNTDIIQRDISTGENAIVLNADWPDGTPPADNGGIFLYRGNSDNTTGISWDEGTNEWKIVERSGVNPSDPNFPDSGGGVLTSAYKVWHEGNMGTGSGLDADTLDGNTGSFYRDAGNLVTGTLSSARFTDGSHGTRGGGSLHNTVTTSSHGFMSSTDKVKLDGIAASADANQTINAGAGMIGGGTSSNVTLNVVGGDGITANADNIAVDGTVVRTSGGTISNLTISGDLSVQGTTTLSNVESVSSTDPFIVLNTDYAGSSPTEDQGLIARRGTLSNATIYWDESDGEWSVGTTTALNLNSPTKLGKIWHSGNDGAGSGLDADLLDGLSSASYARSARVLTAGTGLTGGGNLTANRTFNLDTTYTDARYLNIGDKAADSDKLDNLNSSQFLRSDTADTMTSGSLTFNDNIELYLGTGKDVTHFVNGSHYYTDLNSGIGNWYIRDGTTTRFTFDDAGSFSATGDLTAGGNLNLNGTQINGDGKKILAFGDAWLRINDTSGFTNGIYCGSSILRTDGSFQVGSNGASFLANSSGVTAPSFNTTSSARYKYDIKETPEQMSSSLMKLRPVNYKRKATGKSENGFIAEDMVSVYPDLVARNTQGQVESIDYTKLVVPLVATTQQHNKKLETTVKALTKVEHINKANRDKLKEQEKEIIELKRTLDSMQSRDISNRLAKGRTLSEAEMLKLELRELRSWKSNFEATFSGLVNTVAKSENVISDLLKDKELRDAELAKLKEEQSSKKVTAKSKPVAKKATSKRPKAKAKAKAKTDDKKIDFKLKKDIE